MIQHQGVQLQAHTAQEVVIHRKDTEKYSSTEKQSGSGPTGASGLGNPCSFAHGALDPREQRAVELVGNLELDPMPGVEHLNGTLRAEVAHDRLGRLRDAHRVARAPSEEHWQVELQLRGDGYVGRVSSCAWAWAGAEQDRMRAHLCRLCP